MVTNTVQLRMGKRERGGRGGEEWRERQAKCIGSLTARLLATLNDPLVPFPLPTFTSTSPHSTPTFSYVVKLSEWYLLTIPGTTIINENSIYFTVLGL